MCHERSPGVEKHLGDHRHDGKREDIDTDEQVAHHQRDQNGENRDQEIEHENIPGLLIVFPPENHQIRREEDDECQDEKRLTEKQVGHVFLARISSLQFHLQGFQFAGGILVHDLTSIDDFLTFLHRTYWRSYIAQDLVYLLLVASLIINEIRPHIIVEVKRNQFFPMLGYLIVIEESLVGRLFCEHLIETLGVELFAGNDIDGVPDVVTPDILVAHDAF